jgi:hypothetical protein
MVASVLPDLDGLSLLGGVDSYQTDHHVLCHNLTVGLAATLAVVYLCRCSLKASVMFFLLFWACLEKTDPNSGGFDVV